MISAFSRALRSASVIVLLALLFLTLLAMSLAPGGCSAPASAAEINAGSVASYEKASSLKYTLDVDVAMEFTGQDRTETVTAVLSGAVSWDKPNKKTLMASRMDIEIPQAGKQTRAAECYVIGDLAYMREVSSGAGENWVKARLTDDLRKTLSLDQADEEMELIRSASQVDLLGTEKVDGVECYIIRLTPNMAKLTEWVISREQSASSGFLDPGRINPEKLFKKYVFTTWVAKDSRQLLKEVINVEINATAQDMGYPEGIPGGLVLKINGQMRFSDYNQPVSISLPAEAANAREVSLPVTAPPPVTLAPAAKDQPGLAGGQRVSILGGEVALTLPPGFRSLSGAVIRDIFPSGAPPQYVFANTDASVTIAAGILSSDFSREQMAELSGYMIKALASGRGGIEGLVQGYETFAGQEWLHLEFTSTALDTKIHNSMYYTVYDRKLLLINFTAAEGQYPVVRGVLEASKNSLEIKR